MQSTNVGIRDAKTHLSKYLKMIQGGNEIILTDRGKPVAKIVPIQAEDMPLLARIKRLEDKGLIEALPAEARKGKLPLPIPVSDNIAQRYLREDRENG